MKLEDIEKSFNKIVIKHIYYSDPCVNDLIYSLFPKLLAVAKAAKEYLPTGEWKYNEHFETQQKLEQALKELEKE